MMSTQICDNKETKPSSARQFVGRTLILSLVHAFFFLLLSGLFNDSSDADFNPVQPGALFYSYHITLGIIVVALMAPGFLLINILSLAGLNFTGADTFCFAFSSAFYGFLAALLWRFIIRFRSRSQTN